MKSDLYTKIVLTVISVVLLLNVVGNWPPASIQAKLLPEVIAKMFM